MDAEVETYVKGCDSCLACQNSPAMAPLHPWEVASKPWERVHLDYAGPFLGRMFLIITDAFSKWIDVHHVATASSANTIEKLRITIATHGLPELLVSDNATCFVSDEFKQFCRNNEVTCITSAP